MAIVELLVRRLGKEDVEKAMPKGKEKMLESILKNERIREKKEEIDENVSELEIGESDEEDEEEDGEEEEEEDGEEEKDEEDIKSDDGEIEMEEEELNTLTQNNEEVIETGDQKEDLTELLKEIAANENLKKAVKRRKEWEYGSLSIPQKKRK